MKLSTLRQQANLTPTAVAKALNVSLQSVYRYERGEHKISIEQALQLSELYDCDVRDVIEAQLNSCQCDR